jgi:hypothetical protein
MIELGDSMVPRPHIAKYRAVLTLVTPLPKCSTSFDSIAKPSATAAHLHGESALDVIFAVLACRPGVNDPSTLPNVPMRCQSRA